MQCAGPFDQPSLIIQIIQVREKKRSEKYGWHVSTILRRQSWPWSSDGSNKFEYDVFIMSQNLFTNLHFSVIFPIPPLRAPSLMLYIFIGYPDTGGSQLSLLLWHIWLFLSSNFPHRITEPLLIPSLPSWAPVSHRPSGFKSSWIPFQQAVTPCNCPSTPTLSKSLPR